MVLALDNLVGHGLCPTLVEFGLRVGPCPVPFSLKLLIVRTTSSMSYKCPENKVLRGQTKQEITNNKVHILRHSSKIFSLEFIHWFTSLDGLALIGRFEKYVMFPNSMRSKRNCDQFHVTKMLGLTRSPLNDIFITVVIIH